MKLLRKKPSAHPGQEDVFKKQVTQNKRI